MMAFVPDLSTWLIHWRYVALAVVIVLGNVGLPVPEETVLIVAGYLVREGHLSLGTTLVVGVLSAIAGDNLGYWLGRAYGRPLLLRGARWVRITPSRLDRVERFVARYGVFTVVVARFVAGLRMLGGPLAGAGGVRPVPFIVANVVGALLFVPYALGLGYLLGHGIGAVRSYLGPRAGDSVTWLVIGGLALVLVAVAVAVRRARRRRDRIRGS